MSNGYLADFFFTGLGVAPVLLTFSGHLDLALMSFCPLLVAAMLAGMNEWAADERQDAVAEPAAPEAGLTAPRAGLVGCERRRPPEA